MRITLNLASKPFIELRPLYSRLRWFMAILLLAAVPLWLLLKTERQKAAQANAKLQGVESAIQRLKNQQQGYQALMRQPQNAAVLTQAVFLNQLFARKSFSWTAIMMDLETVLPGGVQVLNIDPVTDKAGNVTIRLRVSGQRDRAVDLVRNLEHSRHFLEPQLASESAETSNNGNQANLQAASETGNVNFDILAQYNPLQTPDALAKKPVKDATGSAPAATKSSSAKGSKAAAGQKHGPASKPKAGQTQPPSQPQNQLKPAQPGAKREP